MRLVFGSTFLLPYFLRFYALRKLNAAFSFCKAERRRRQIANHQSKTIAANESFRRRVNSGTIRHKNSFANCTLFSFVNVRITGVMQVSFYYGNLLAVVAAKPPQWHQHFHYPPNQQYVILIQPYYCLQK